MYKIAVCDDEEAVSEQVKNLTPGIIEHCRDGEVAGKGTIPNV